ncbi:MAG: RES domain-containing protein [Candidatus Limnocylindrales bacterium]
MLYRVYRALEGVAPAARGGPLFVPREYQGAGRHDAPGRYGAFYAARSAVAAVAEVIQAFRGRDLLPEDLERSDGTRLMLAAYDDSGLEALLDLDEPAVLVEEGWRPSVVASRDRAVTQAMAVRAFEAGALGLSWWSTLDAAWTNVTLFAERVIEEGGVVVDGSPERLSLQHPAVVAAADHLAIPLVRRRRRRGR